MNSKILNTEVQNFINANLHEEISKIIFRGSPFDGITVQELANQILAKKKSEKKLPTWFQTKNIYYPEKISIEQTSSEVTANYKSKLVNGDSIVDLSGGFGIDSFYFSKKFNEVVHCEINNELSEIVTHNYKQLGINTIQTLAVDGISHIKNNETFYDWIYIDPSRRDDVKGKVFLLQDCAPNVPEELDVLFSKSENILIKVSPILDITSTLRELKNTKEVHIVALNNEVKELLFVLQKGFNQPIMIKTVNLLKENSQHFEFTLEDNTYSESIYSLPEKYLYEPNSAILKSGGFTIITEQFNVKKLHQHSHLYTSNELIDFPGRKFLINSIVPYNKKEIKKIIPNKKANITVRNFPKTVEQIRKETKIADGGDIYLFFTTLKNNSKVMIVSNKIN